MLRFLVPLLVTFSLFSCSPSSPPATRATPELTGIVEAYRAWMVTQGDSLVAQTEAFTKAVEAGDLGLAKRLYAPTRVFYERIEPAAEGLGDLDPRIDAREGDVPEEEWGGFHRLEKGLWVGGSGMGDTARRLREDVHLLRAKLETVDISVPFLVTGAVELLNEVSTSKVTGEEDRYSHTDLWDFQANVEGSQKIWDLVAAVVKTTDAPLAATLDQRFASLQALLATHRRDQGFRLYTELSPEDVKALAAAVDAVAEPLSQLGSLFAQEEGKS